MLRFGGNMRRVTWSLKRVLQWMRQLLGPGGGTLDPFAGTREPVTKRPPQRSGSVAVAEPDDER